MTTDTIDTLEATLNDTSTQATTDAFLALKAKMEALDEEISAIEEKRQKLIWKNLAGAITPKEFEEQLALITKEENDIEDQREIHLESLRLIMTDNT